MPFVKDFHLEVFTLTAMYLSSKISLTRADSESASQSLILGSDSMIRFAKEADIPAILDIYGPYVSNTAISFEYSVPTLEEFMERFRSTTAQFPWLVWEEDGVVLGYAYGSLPFGRAAYRWCAAGSIYLAPSAQRKGIGRKLYEALEQLLKAQGYRKLYALITSDNPGSLRFHEAMGYRFLAQFSDSGIKFQKLYSVIWMEKTLNDGEIPNNFPSPINEIVNVDSFVV